MAIQYVVEVQEYVPHEPAYVYEWGKFPTQEEAIPVARALAANAKTTYGEKPEVRIYLDGWKED